MFKKNLLSPRILGELLDHSDDLFAFDKCISADVTHFHSSPSSNPKCGITDVTTGFQFSERVVAARAYFTWTDDDRCHEKSPADWTCLPTREISADVALSHLCFDSTAPESFPAYFFDAIANTY